MRINGFSISLLIKSSLDGLTILHKKDFDIGSMQLYVHQYE